MRWIVSIVTAFCLLAAASERHDPRHTYGSDSPELTLANHGASTCTPARRGSSAPHARLDAFVAFVAPAPAPAVRVLALASAMSSSPAREARPRNVSIRGPPLG